MTNKITIAIVLIAVLVIATTMPTADAQQRDVSREAYLDKCDNVLHDDRGQWHEFGCIYFPELWNSISDIVNRLALIENIISTLQTNIGDNSKSLTTLNDTLSNSTAQINTTTDSLDKRLQVLEGKIPPPEIGDPLVVNVTPDSIVEGETFTVYGHVDRIEQYWVDFEVQNPNGTGIQWFGINTLQNGGFYPPAISPNDKWTMNGTYTILAKHGIHNSTNTIQYTLDENP